MSQNGQFFAASAVVILNRKGEVLLTQRALHRDHHPGAWEITTGRLLQGESFEAALHREVREELSITVSIVAPLSTFHFFRGAERAEHVGVRFLCVVRSGTPKVDGIEEIDVQWLPLPAAVGLVKDKSVESALRDAKRFVGRFGAAGLLA